MRAILLAAGRGARLARGDEAPPKCLLAFDGRTLLERHLAILRDAGVDEVVIAVGYRRALVEAELARLAGRFDGLCTTVVVNDDFALGSVLTVHVARDALVGGGDVLLMDADVLYDPRIVQALVAGPSVDRLLIDRDFEAGDEPVKVCIADGAVVEFGKRVAPGLSFDTIGESVGFFRFRQTTATRLAARVADYVASGRASEPHEAAVRDLLLDGVDGLDVADVTGLPWIEIDFPADVARAADAVLPAIERMERIET